MQWRNIQSIRISWCKQGRSRSHMENNTETQTKRQKPIFQIETKREYEKKTDKDGNEYTTDNYTSWTLTHKVEVLKPSDISEQTDETIDFANQVKKEFEKLFDKRNSNLSTGQLEFCYDTALSILGELKDRSKITVIPARAGFGKSSFIYSFLSVFCDYINLSFLELIKEQGVIIVTDKLDALRNLEKLIFESKGYFDEETNTKFTYLLESWNKDSYSAGVCKDEGITEFKESMCSGACSYYKACKMSKQKIEQKYSPILLMTNARFYQHCDKIDEYSEWLDEHGKIRKRDIIIIDEKPNMVHSGQIESRSFSKLIDIIENSINSEKDEKTKLFFINKTKNIEEKFNSLRERLSIYRNSIYPKNNEIAFSEEFIETWKNKIGPKGLDIICDINTLFRDGALWCRTKIPYFGILESKIPHYDNFKTFIFDATAELDPDYKKKDKFQFLDVDCYKDYKNISIHTYYNKNLNMSRTSLGDGNKWKIKAITKWMNNNIEKFASKTYAICYGFCAKEISKDLISLKKSYCLDLGSKIAMIPHFGDTKGSNDYIDAFTMVQLGWNRISSDLYLKNTLCLWCDVEKVLSPLENKEKRSADSFEMKNGVFTKFDSPNEYMWMQLAAGFEQEIFRTAVRDFSVNKPVDIYVFYPNPKVIDLIKQRLNCSIINHNDELPIEFEHAKITERGNSNSKYKIQKFLAWIETWDGEEISIRKIREMFGISEAYWKVVSRNEVVSKIKGERKIQSKRKGKGKNQEMFWIIKK